jgi:LmbE family N-acetylglucosaminyl deacetylase
MSMDLGRVGTALVIAPHGDDEVLGVGGLITTLTGCGATVRVIFMAVDASAHYGLSEPTTLAQRLDEIAAVSRLLDFDHKIVYSGTRQLERLDTIPQRDLVDILEKELDLFRPELLLIPHGDDYDQDHRACFQAALAATRPIPQQIGKHLVKRVLTYEMPKLVWANAFRPNVYLDITSVIERKLESIALYKTQLRENPHVRSLANIRALAQLRGSEIGVSYAEAYQALRWII